MILFRALYDLGVRAYQLAISIAAAAGKEKARRWKQGRRQWAQRLRAAINPGIPLIWVHAASLGEFEQGRPVLEGLRREYPNHKILLTFFSPSGYEVRKDYPGADHICYLPLDTRRNARDFLNIAQPRLVLFIKYEFWYHFLTEIYIRKIPLLLVSGVFRPGQVFFRWYGGPFRRMLQQFSHLFVQNGDSLRLLQRLHVKNASISGDTRFDRVWALRHEHRALPVITQFTAGKRVIVAGSTWPADESLWAAYWWQAPPELALVIAPHEIHTSHLEQIMALFPQAQYYTQLAAGTALRSNVLIMDNIGMLSALYRYAAVTFVGGGFGKEGIHNILEPATYGKPVLFGPRFDKFPEAPALIAAGGAFVVENAITLRSCLDGLLQQEEAMQAASAAAARFVAEGQGATAKVLAYIAQQDLLKPD